MWFQSTASTLCVLSLVSICGVFGVEVNPSTDFEGIDGLAVSYGEWIDASTWTLAGEQGYIYDWPMQLMMTQNYQFTGGESSISFEIMGNGASNDQKSDLYIGFGDGSRYLTFAIDFDGKYTINPKHNNPGIFISPDCAGALQQGDVADVLEGIENGGTPNNFHLQLSHVLAGGSWWMWNKLTSSPNGNTWPVTITVTNNARDGTSTFRVVSNTIDLSCSFTEAFAADTPLTFGMVPDVLKDMQIESITVEMEIPLVYRGNIVNGEGTTCSGTDCLAECEGDCDSDFHCEGDYLVCWHRDGDDIPIPPGCTGVAQAAATDYCYNPAKKERDDEGNLPYVHRGHNHNARRVALQECEGECDNDDNCDGDLKCFHRNNDDVPGCYGETHGSGSGFDYCWNAASVDLGDSRAASPLAVQISSSGSSGSGTTTPVPDYDANASSNDGNAAIWTWSVVAVIASLIICGAYYGSNHWIKDHQSRDIDLAEQQRQKVHSIEISDCGSGIAESGTMEQSSIPADGDRESRQIANGQMERNGVDDDDDERRVE